MSQAYDTVTTGAGVAGAAIGTSGNQFKNAGGPGQGGAPPKKRLSPPAPERGPKELWGASD